MGGRRFEGVSGPLADFDAGFTAELKRLGYGRDTIRCQRMLMGDVSSWMLVEGCGLAGFSSRTGEFLVARREAGFGTYVALRGLCPLLDYLVGLGVMPPLERRREDGPAAVLVERYRSFLLVERGLRKETTDGYIGVARQFLAACVSGGVVDAAGITAVDIYTFLREVCPSKSRGAAALTATVSRSLLGWLFLEGITAVPLAGFVPRVGSWRLAGLVEPVASADVALLLGSCDLTTIVGRRDFAMLNLLSRLGLRAGEVARLVFDDIDWRSGEIVIRGKGPKDARLPLPVDVGRAVADYLVYARPVSGQGRTVFVRVQAPHRAMTNGGVTQAVMAASKRAGLEPMYAHRLRHTAASSMLAAGASLRDIGEVLRHERVGTTVIYTKIDIGRLRHIARPWPAGL